MPQEYFTERCDCVCHLDGDGHIWLTAEPDAEVYGEHPVGNWCCECALPLRWHHAALATVLSLMGSPQCIGWCDQRGPTTACPVPEHAAAAQAAIDRILSTCQLPGCDRPMVGTHDTSYEGDCESGPYAVTRRYCALHHPITRVAFEHKLLRLGWSCTCDGGPSCNVHDAYLHDVEAADIAAELRQLDSSSGPVCMACGRPDDTLDADSHLCPACCPYCTPFHGQALPADNRGGELRVWEAIDRDDRTVEVVPCTAHRDALYAARQALGLD